MDDQRAVTIAWNSTKSLPSARTDAGPEGLQPPDDTAGATGVASLRSRPVRGRRCDFRIAFGGRHRLRVRTRQGPIYLLKIQGALMDATSRPLRLHPFLQKFANPSTTRDTPFSTCRRGSTGQSIAGERAVESVQSRVAQLEHQGAGRLTRRNHRAGKVLSSWTICSLHPSA